MNIFRKLIKSKYNRNKFYRIFISTAFLVIVVSLFSLILKNDSEQRNHAYELLLNKYASNIIKICKSSRYKTGCYEKELPKLLKVISLGDSFRVLKKIQYLDRNYSYCHVSAHNLAEEAVHRNPSEWTKVIAQCPSMVCDNGCSHGALIGISKETAFSSVDIKKALSAFVANCKEMSNFHPSDAERIMCYHGLGHAIMYITQGNIAESISKCGISISSSEGKVLYHTCLRGVFMQIFQPLDDDGRRLTKNILPSKETAITFCDKFNDEPRLACHLERAILFSNEIKHYSDLVKYCSYTKNIGELKSCYYVVEGNVVVRMLWDGIDVKEISDFCNDFPKSALTYCFSIVSARIIKIDPSYLPKALEICKSAERHYVGDRCYKTLAAYGTFAFGEQRTKELKQYCIKLPKPWNQKCINKEYKGTII